MSNSDQDDDILSWSPPSPDGAMPGAFAPPDLPDVSIPEPAPTQPSGPPALPAPQLPIAAPALTAPQMYSPLPVQSVQAAKRPSAARSHYTPQVNPDVTQRGNMLGFATVATGVGAVAGLRLGGIYGGIAGTLFAGAATNAYRAVIHHRTGTESGKREAMVSGTWAIVSAGLGGYLLYMTRAKRGVGMTPNEAASEGSSSGSCATKNGRRSCGIRAIV